MSHYDVIVIGSGAGGGTLAHRLAPSGKQVLLLERGDWLPREPQNWSAADVFVDNRYVSPDTWYDSDGKPFQPDASKDTAWNRGAYLVNGPGHCAECHSPRNFLGGIIESQRFAGGPEPTGDGFVPNITQKSLTLSQENLVKLLETGETPDGDTIGGEMAKVTSNTGKLSAADREAIATYVRSLPPVEGPKRPESK